jgi:hypothetical protein
LEAIVDLADHMELTDTTHMQAAYTIDELDILYLNEQRMTTMIEILLNVRL